MRDLDLAEGRRLSARADYFNCYSGHPNAVAASDWLRLHATALLDLAERCQAAEATLALREALSEDRRVRVEGLLGILQAAEAERDRLSASYSQALDSLHLAEKHSDEFAAEANALRLKLERIRATSGPKVHWATAGEATRKPRGMTGPWGGATPCGYVGVRYWPKTKAEVTCLRCLKAIARGCP